MTLEFQTYLHMTSICRAISVIMQEFEQKTVNVWITVTKGQRATFCSNAFTKG